MKLTLKAVSIHGSKSHYGSEPFLMPKDGYFKLLDYPSDAEKFYVSLGNL